MSEQRQLEFSPNGCGVPKLHSYLGGMTPQAVLAMAEAASSHGCWRRWLHFRLARVRNCPPRGRGARQACIARMIDSMRGWANTDVVLARHTC